jgi:hypothetical protein
MIYMVGLGELFPLGSAQEKEGVNLLVVHIMDQTML